MPRKLNQSEMVCLSKQAYTSELIVQTVLNMSLKDTSQDYYRCKICNNFHIYTLNNKVSQKREVKKFTLENKEVEKQKNKRYRQRRKGQ